MPTILARTTLSNGATQEVDTDGLTNIVVNVKSGEATVNVIVDGAQTDGYPVF